jgi:MoaA/NifB/PqqE/SkfB family radical SAM enzyme
MQVGWSLGSTCPYSCVHCYSRQVRLPATPLTESDVERVVRELVSNQACAVVLGGNEPIFTNGNSARESLLPLIIDSLHHAGISASVVTSGPTVSALKQLAPWALKKLAYVWVSLDSPIRDEHDANRGAKLFDRALTALAEARLAGVSAGILYCATSKNFNRDRMTRLADLAAANEIDLRINTFKPTDSHRSDLCLDANQFLEGFAYLTERCETYIVGDPLLRWLMGIDARAGCACGRATYRITNLTPSGELRVTPCIYAHDFSAGDLRQQRLCDIRAGAGFERFEQRRQDALAFGEIAEATGGGCLAQAITAGTGLDPMLNSMDRRYQGSLANAKFGRSPHHHRLFSDYLCTWIGRPHN